MRVSSVLWAVLGGDAVAGMSRAVAGGDNNDASIDVIRRSCDRRAAASAACCAQHQHRRRRQYKRGAMAYAPDNCQHQVAFSSIEKTHGCAAYACIRCLMFMRSLALACVVAEGVKAPTAETSRACVMNGLFWLSRLPSAQTAHACGRPAYARVNKRKAGVENGRGALWEDMAANVAWRRRTVM